MQQNELTQEEKLQDEVLREAAVLLLEWFDGHARILPWREEVTPYRVWVSEIMLQQTRVEAVKPFFQRFTQALPNVEALANCEEDRLLKLWEGLGYYNRVRNMQTAAKTVMQDYDGELPADYQALLSLKGIGSYTAGAVASIAYNLPVPAVDGNVLRVISRLLELYDDIMKDSVKKAMETRIRRIMPEDRPGAFNQALMELGATVCVPNGPARCEECPWQELCQARKHGTISELPVKAAKKKRRIEERTILIISDGDRAAICRRPDHGLLRGMYELPSLEGHLSQDEVLDYLRTQNFSPLHIRTLSEAKHIFSHVEWRMIGYQIRIEEPEEYEEKYLFVEPEETEKNYPIPAAFSAYVRYLDIRLGQEKYEEEQNK
ncbi:MAG: A/G-specific adenine glycosylase [Eubacteriales bacterium]|nr:A/G-specific adenine glycosylase [Eubacteriales bacterium]